MTSNPAQIANSAPSEETLERAMSAPVSAEKPAAAMAKTSTALSALSSKGHPAGGPDNLGFRAAWKQTRRGALWALLFMTSIIMEGFDLGLLSGFYAFPAFQKQFGQYDAASDTHELPSGWQTALSAGAQIGQIIGLTAAGIVAQRVGYKRTMLMALAWMFACIFAPVFATTRSSLLAGEILQGMAWGVFETMPGAYAADIAHVEIRPYLTTFSNVCWVMGQLIAGGVLRAFLPMGGDSTLAYRIPFALQWVWPVPIFIGICFAPESPSWLLRNEKGESKVRRALRKTAKHTEKQLDDVVALMTSSCPPEVQQERAATLAGRLKAKVAKAGVYADCFRSVDARRTEISCGVWVCQSLCGSGLMAFAPYFFVQAGLQTDKAYEMQIVAAVLGILGTLVSWALMRKLGRRTIYASGLAVLAVLLWTMAALGVVLPGLKDEARKMGTMTVAVLLVVYIFIYNSTVGPCCYSLVNEMPSTRLRAPTVALARICYNICGILSNVLNPMFLNPTALALGPKTAFLWAGTCSLCCVWTFVRLPEPKGKTSEELDTLFNEGAPARKFQLKDKSSTTA